MVVATVGLRILEVLHKVSSTSEGTIRNLLLSRNLRSFPKGTLKEELSEVTPEGVGPDIVCGLQSPDLERRLTVETTYRILFCVPTSENLPVLSDRRHIGFVRVPLRVTRVHTC